MNAKNEGGDGDEAMHRGSDGKSLKPEARRALDEAAARRAAQKAVAGTAAPVKKEVGGRDGPEPIRYGDWEVKGRASDF